MKNLIIFFSFAVIFLATAQTTQAQSNKQLVQLINMPSDVQKLLIQLPKNRVTIKTSYSNQILIKTTIRLSVEDDKLMDYLADKGRYDLLAEKNPNQQEFILEATPQIQGEITGKDGLTITEHISYTIYIPNQKLEQIHIKTPKSTEISVLRY